MILVPSAGRELSNPPSDGISNLRFSDSSDHLLVFSWDKSVRLYDASADSMRGEFKHGVAVLDFCFHDESSGFSACSDHKVRRIDFNAGKEDILGMHEEPVRCVEYSYAAGQVITGSWDKTIKCWDPRAATGRHVNVYDVRNMVQPEQRRESSLKYQTRCVRCYPNGTGYMADMFVFQRLKDMHLALLKGGFQWNSSIYQRLLKLKIMELLLLEVVMVSPMFEMCSFAEMVDYWLLLLVTRFKRDTNRKHEPNAIFVWNVNEIKVKPKPKVYPNPPA
ncbi:hypothetical protein Bca101_058765 [Brassica carinata]